MATNLENPNANAEVYPFENELRALKGRILWKKTEKQPQKKEEIPPITKEEYESLCKKTTLSIPELKKVIQYNKDKNEWVSPIERDILKLSIKTLTDEQARLLSWVKDLVLKLDTITDNQATMLWNCKILSIELSAATNIQIKNLVSKWNSMLVTLPQTTKIQSDSLKDLTIKTDILTPEQAHIISWRSRIKVLWLKQMEWTIYSKPWQNIEIEIEKLTDSQMEALCKATRLRLDKLTALTDKQAETLSKWKFNNLALFWLTKLTDKQAEFLSKIPNLHFRREILTPKQRVMFEKKSQ